MEHRKDQTTFSQKTTTTCFSSPFSPAFHSSFPGPALPCRRASIISGQAAFIPLPSPPLPLRLVRPPPLFAPQKRTSLCSCWPPWPLQSWPRPSPSRPPRPPLRSSRRRRRPHVPPRTSSLTALGPRGPPSGRRRRLRTPPSRRPPSPRSPRSRRRASSPTCTSPRNRTSASASSTPRSPATTRRGRRGTWSSAPKVL